MALYNEMRPMRLSGVKGQERVVKVLTDNLASGHLPNSMLFVGTRGTGKTTVAKIVAKTVNCTNPTETGECCCECEACRTIKNGENLDVLELDAASNNGVDDVRKIIEMVQFRPIGKKKVVILDEVHMLSNGAFNALLKIMEEPPKDVLFILCTTELHKVPATILSRCRKFQFENITVDTIVGKLKEICEKYSLNAEEGALRLVAKAANGSMRDAESIFEAFIDEECVTSNLVREHLGFSSEELIFAILNSITSREPSGAFDAVRHVVNTGGNLVFLLEECMRVLLDVIFVQSCGDISALVGSEDYLNNVSDIAFNVKPVTLLEIANAFREAYEKRNSNMELVMQGMVVSLMCECSAISVLEEKVAKLEKMLASGTVLPQKNVVEEVPETVESFVDVPVEEEIVENIVSPEQKNGGNDNGFVQLSEGELAELATLGFSVETPACDRETGTAPKEVMEETEDVEENSGMFFNDFARQFGDGFGSFGY